MIRKALELQAQGKKFEAVKYYTYLIKQGIKDYRVCSNYGIFLNEIGKHQEAELELESSDGFAGRNRFFFTMCIDAR